MAFFQSERMMAIVERDLRKFFRSPALMMAAMVFPLVQLIVLGNAFGGKIRDAKLGIGNQDGGPQAIRDYRADYTHSGGGFFRDTPFNGDIRVRARDNHQVLFLETDDAGALFRFTDT